MAATRKRAAAKPKTATAKRTTRTAAKKATGLSMRAVAVKALAANANRPMKVKAIYAAMVEAGYVQGAGKTPTATLSVVLLKGDEFEKTGPGEYRLTTAAYKAAKAETS